MLSSTKRPVVRPTGARPTEIRPSGAGASGGTGSGGTGSGGMTGGAGGGETYPVPATPPPDEDGSQLWLRYKKVPLAGRLAEYQAALNHVVKAFISFGMRCEGGASKWIFRL